MNPGNDRGCHRGNKTKAAVRATKLWMQMKHPDGALLVPSVASTERSITMNTSFLTGTMVAFAIAIAAGSATADPFTNNVGTVASVNQNLVNASQIPNLGCRLVPTRACSGGGPQGSQHPQTRPSTTPSTPHGQSRPGGHH
jgi:hypothetical protein